MAIINDVRNYAKNQNPFLHTISKPELSQPIQDEKKTCFLSNTIRDEKFLAYPSFAMPDNFKDRSISFSGGL